MIPKLLIFEPKEHREKSKMGFDNQWPEKEQLIVYLIYNGVLANKYHLSVAGHHLYRVGIGG